MCFVMPTFYIQYTVSVGSTQWHVSVLINFYFNLIMSRTFLWVFNQGFVIKHFKDFLHAICMHGLGNNMHISGKTLCFKHEFVIKKWKTNWSQMTHDSLHFYRCGKYAVLQIKLVVIMIHLVSKWLIDDSDWQVDLPVSGMCQNDGWVDLLTFLAIWVCQNDWWLFWLTGWPFDLPVSGMCQNDGCFLMDGLTFETVTL